MNLVKSEYKKIVQRFKWRDKNGNCHNLEDMETRHLFFTLRMIWNHTVKECFRIEPYKAYQFSSFYAGKYMGDAVKAISGELAKRNDLTEYFKICLRHMVNCINGGALDYVAPPISSKEDEVYEDDEDPSDDLYWMDKE